MHWEKSSLLLLTLIKNHIWSLRRDERSGVLIGTGGARRSDWPVREKRSIARVQGQATAGTQLAATISLPLANQTLSRLNSPYWILALG